MKPLFIYEIANNHQGSVEHGKKILKELKKVSADFKEEFDFAVKFQFRNLDTFIHPAYQARDDIKNVKRFRDTRLTKEQFKELFEVAIKYDFHTICTPFDEDSVEHIVEMGFEYLKIASCSAMDWPLLDKIASARLPVIASAAGCKLDDVRRLVAFFENRQIEISLMHCVAEYPTPEDRLQLNQIDLYKKEFPNHRIGFSTHENPDNYEAIKLAVAKGAQIFEKHVGVQMEMVTLNGYSANPEQVRGWLQAAHTAYLMCGVLEKRYEPSEKEISDLAALQRGVFVRDALDEMEEIHLQNTFLAFPCQKGQLLAKDLSKYNKITLKEDKKLEANAPIMLSDVTIESRIDLKRRIVRKVMHLLEEGNVVVPAGSICEISHHYGIEQFEQIGVAIINCINREYCKKILVVLPGQSHPSHYHVKKEETFLVLHGDLIVECDGAREVIRKGEKKTIERNKKHSFSSETGCVFEEISTTHYENDSFYEEQDRFVIPRKTEIFLTQRVLDKQI